MDECNQPFNVGYKCEDDSVNFTGGMRNIRKGPQQIWERKMRTDKCSLMVPWQTLLLTFLITVGSTYTVLIFFFVSKPSCCRETGAPNSDVENLSLSETRNNSFTVTWKRPEGIFDSYVIYISANDDDSIVNAPTNVTGSCTNATLIPRDQTQLTCSHVAPCSNVTIQVRTYSAGPPEHTSMGVTLRHIFIPADEPLPPFGITVTSISSSRTLLRWQTPPKVSGVTTGYIVQICDTFAVCDSDENVRGCTEHRTSETFLEAETTADSSYCVLVIAIVRCGREIFGSPPAAQEVRTPAG